METINCIGNIYQNLYQFVPIQSYLGKFLAFYELISYVLAAITFAPLDYFYNTWAVSLFYGCKLIFKLHPSWRFF
ncbi:MAG: hypothetical protein BWX90_01415 [bacterium ADurb.Bin132]|nr:MAG: hypothetical protein BWX90_01415 [bacterium ADurb.Bin132]